MKNIIVLENDNTIKKTFLYEMDYYTEKSFYEEFKGFQFIPKVVSEGDVNCQDSLEISLYLEHIKGKSLYDCNTTEQLYLAETLGKFHKETFDQSTGMCLVHFDTNLSNYLYKDDKVFMLDFSDIAIASPLVDVYSVMLFFAEIHEPEVFFIFFDEFLKRYFDALGCELQHLEDILKKEIDRFENRREEHKKCINNYHLYLQNVKTLKLCM